MDKLFEEELKSQFEKATHYVKSVAGKLDAKILLYLYARYKQVNDGPCNAPKPGFFDFQGKQKWEAWRSVKDLSKTDAMHQYIAAVSEYDPEWEEKIDSGVIKKTSGLGVGVSTLASQEEDLTDDQKTIFDWCKEGNMDRVTTLLTRQKSDVDINKTDENGMSLLHWCCDRGHAELVYLLLRHNANINTQDIDGQTALHYAASCDHEDIVQILLSHGADKSLVDSEGNRPVDVTDNVTVRQMLVSK